MYPLIADHRTARKCNAYVKASVLCGLLTTPGHGRRGKAAASRLSFAQISNQRPQVHIVQRRYIVSGDFEHDFPAR
jgi:hypothetical protein